jgi:para-nitrobenzyl esterase
MAPPVAALRRLRNVATAVTPLSHPIADESAAAAEDSATVVVDAPCGAVRGHDRGNAAAFFGIPFATAERWRPPQPAVAWEGVHDATSIGPACPQSDHPVPGFAASGPQDERHCLNLNLFASTSTSTSTKKPVLFWIHGGGFTHGAAYEPLYDGGILAAEGDCVVVSCNYRTGALGFLSLAGCSSDFSANNGLRDIVAALEWTRDSVAAWGGDPDNVTVFGESAGGVAVFCLLAMPSAAGLFAKAVCQSGGGSEKMPTARAAARTLDAMVGDGGSWEQLVDCPVEDILRAQVSNQSNSGVVVSLLSLSGNKLIQLPAQGISRIILCVSPINRSK